MEALKHGTSTAAVAHGAKLYMHHLRPPTRKTRATMDRMGGKHRVFGVAATFTMRAVLATLGEPPTPTPTPTPDAAPARDCELSVRAKHKVAGVSTEWLVTGV